MLIVLHTTNLTKPAPIHGVIIPVLALGLVRFQTNHQILIRRAITLVNGVAWPMLTCFYSKNYYILIKFRNRRTQWGLWSCTVR